MTFKRFLALLAPFAIALPAFSQIVSVGAGSYTTTMPSGGSAPQSTVYTTASGPVPTHKFWTSKYWNALSGGYNMSPQPLTTTVAANGLTIGFHGIIDGWNPNTSSSTDHSSVDTAFFQETSGDLTIGNASVNASSVNVSATSDWTADLTWDSTLTIRIGRGMPFAYVLTNGTAPTVTFIRTPTIQINNGNILVVSTPEATSGFTNYYGLFCPSGGSWTQSSLVFTCHAPSGSNYMSVALLPGLSTSTNANTTTLATQLASYTPVAFSFPTNTQVSWSYNSTTSAVTTTYTVTTKAMDGSSTGFLMALYPHQYDAVSSGTSTAYTYLSTRGTMKIYSGTSVTTTDTFHGILPFMPMTTNYNTATLKTYVDEVAAAAYEGDTYNQGKDLGQVAQVLPLAKLVDSTAYSTLDASLESVFQTWFTATTAKTYTGDSFNYNSTWGSLIGYPAGYGSDTCLCDHHFHYGYFLHAAAINGFFNPSWIASSQWGGMAALLQQDIGNYDRTNTMFPFLRYFDVYAGHSWANGQAPFGDGGNEESSSEAVNAWTGMILLGAATGNTQMRDAGIWLYTQETKGVAYYWFNQQPSWVNSSATSTFPSWFSYLRLANLYDLKSDIGTWFGSDPDYEHGIEYLPFTGGSFYLGYSPTYAAKNFNEDYTENGDTLPNWPDIMEEYEAFSNASTAYSNWLNNSSSLFPQFGETLAHEYAWLMSLQDLGQVDINVTANTPFYQVFDNNGTITHVAFNPTSSTETVTFSDGKSLSVAAGTMTSDSSLVTTITLGAGAGGSTTAPSAPTGLSATAASSSQINLSWTLVSGVSYSVYRSTSSGFAPSSSNLIASGLSTASYANTGLSASTTYYYVVEAVNSAGSSPASSQASATTSSATTAPAAPTGVSATAASSTQINLSWTQISGLTYSVYRSTTSGFAPSSSNLIASGLSAASYANTGLSASTTYYYVVEAVNSAGSSPASSQVSATTSAATSAPAAPTNLTATAVSTSQINLSWTASTTSGVTYTVLRYGVAISTGISGTTFSDIGLVASTTYSYTVEAVNANGTSAASNAATVTTPSTTSCTTVPAAPTGLTATASSSSAIGLSWTAVSTPSNCTVTYSVYGGTASNPTTVIASGVTSASYSNTGLAASTTYYYTVTAVDAAGASAASSQASAATQAASSSSYVVAINAGGAASGSFAADEYYGGGTAATTTATISTAGVTNPAPQAVYQSQRYGNFNYTIPGLTAGASYSVTLYFDEFVYSAAGQREFNVSLNGTQVLTNFDIYATAGGADKAVSETFTTTANSSGQIVLIFVGSVNTAEVNGISVALPTSNLIANGTYVITNKNSGLALDDYGKSTTKGTYIDQWAANGGTNQEWTLTNLGNNLVTLTCVKSGYLLDVYNASTASGASIDQWPSNGGTNQIWLVVNEGSGYYELLSEKSGLALGVPGSSTTNGTYLQQLTVTGAANQLWAF